MVLIKKQIVTQALTRILQNFALKVNLKLQVLARVSDLISFQKSQIPMSYVCIYFKSLQELKKTIQDNCKAILIHAENYQALTDMLYKEC